MMVTIITMTCIGCKNRRGGDLKIRFFFFFFSRDIMSIDLVFAFPKKKKKETVTVVKHRLY